MRQLQCRRTNVQKNRHYRVGRDRREWQVLLGRGRFSHRDQDRNQCHHTSKDGNDDKSSYVVLVGQHRPRIVAGGRLFLPARRPTRVTSSVVSWAESINDTESLSYRLQDSWLTRHPWRGRRAQLSNTG